jgi:hypothetical protein
MNLIGPFSCLLDVAHIQTHFVKEKMIQPVKVLHVSQALGEIGANERPELGLIGRIDELHLIEAVEHFGCRDAQTCRPAAGHELLN